LHPLFYSMATLNTLLNDAKGGNDPSSFAAELAGRPAGFIERLVTRVPPAGRTVFDIETLAALLGNLLKGVSIFCAKRQKKNEDDCFQTGASSTGQSRAHAEIA
jgi:hypothetical protein